MENIPQEEHAPTFLLEGIDPRSSSDPLVRTLGIVYVAKRDEYTYHFDIPIPTEFTKRTLLGVLARIYDPAGHIGPYTVAGRLLFQDLCLENPGNGTKEDWDAPVKGERLREFLNWISEAKKLGNITIPRCLRRHSLEPADIQDRNPYYQHSCEDQRECFGGWERFTELESIQWLADGEPANDREGASGVLQLKGNDPMEGATENSLQML